MAPKTGQLLGNCPQAYTHVGLIHAAITIGELLEARDARFAHGRRCPTGMHHTAMARTTSPVVARGRVRSGRTPDPLRATEGLAP